MTEDEAVRAAQASLRAGRRMEREVQVALDDVFARIRPTAVRLARGWLGDAATAEELVQDALTVTWQKLPELELESSLQAYVVGVCRNRLRNDRRKISELLTEDGMVEATSELASALARLRDDEQVNVLRAAIASLPTLEQDAVHLRYVEGRPVDEVTRELGLKTASGARGLLARCRRHLEVLLREALAARGHGSSFFWSSIA
jgi:RNA polymerase sigma-70 factor (ECF subfamily)